MSIRQASVSAAPTSPAAAIPWALGWGVARDAFVRLLVFLAAVFTLAYAVAPVAFATRRPLGVAGMWLLGAALAWWRPKHSLVAWLAISPLLPIVPTLLEWPDASLPTLWLAALAVPAWAKYFWRPRPRALPRSATGLLLLATVSILVVVYPFYSSAPTTGSFFAEVHANCWNYLMFTPSQRPRLSPLMAWAVLGEGLVALWVMLFTFRDGDEDRQRWLVIAAGAMALAAAAVATWGIWQWWTRRDLLLVWRVTDPTIVRVNASFTDVNALGAYLASMLPMALAFAAMAHGIGAAARSALSALAAPAIVASTLFTASRAAWAGAALGTLGMVAGTVRWRLAPWTAGTYRWTARVVTALVLAGTLLLVAATTWATLRDVRLDQQRSYLDVVLYTVNLRAPLEERLKGRGQFWAAGVRMVKAHPWVGLGVGRFYKEVYRWAPNQAALVRPQENAHNYLLQLAAEGGVPTLVAFLALLLAACRAALRACRAAPVHGRFVALASASGIIAFLVTLFTGHSLLLHEGQVTFWPLVGLALLCGREWTNDGPPSRPASGAVALTALTLVLLASLPARLVNAVTLEDTRISGLVAELPPAPGGGDWTGGQVNVDVPRMARAIAVHVRFDAPFAQVVAVSLDGRQVETVQGRPGQSLELRYLLPAAGPKARFRRLTLGVSPTWTLPGTSTEIGVVVESVEWVR